MSETAGALGSLGSDLAFSVSFNIATELLGSANESHLSEEELIGVVLVLAVVLASIPSAFKSIMSAWKRWSGRDETGRFSTSGFFEFLTLLMRTAQRISVSICVQLLASNVRSRQPLRSVRVVSLLAIAIFFLFLESTSSVGGPSRVS